jgi:hypothetical protein
MELQPCGQPSLAAERFEYAEEIRCSFALVLVVLAERLARFQWAGCQDVGQPPARSFEIRD